MLNGFEAASTVKTKLLAAQLEGAVKWKKTDGMTAVYASLLEDKTTNLDAVYISGTEYQELIKSEHKNIDIMGFVDEQSNDALLEKLKTDTATFDTDHYYIVAAPIIDSKKKTHLGNIWTAWTKKEIIANIESAKNTQTITAIAIILALIVILIYLLRHIIITPLNNSINIMTLLTQGKYDIEIPNLNKEDEMGTMARAIEVFRQSAIDKEKSDKAQKEAEENSETERKQLLQDMAKKFEEEVLSIVENLSSSIGDMGMTAKQLSVLASKTETDASEMANFSNQASQNVQTVASASEELNSSVQEIVQQTTRAATLTRKADEQAKETNVVVGTLQEAATKIGDVVKLIQDIAEQTNLLALNATIESARAGEAGKGFAVVANEVKSLATETSKATEEIAEKIKEVQDISNKSSTAINSIASAIVEISMSMTAVTAAIEEQGAATNEISRSAQEAATGTQNVSNGISSVNQSAIETGKIALETEAASHELSNKSNDLKNAVNDFIANIRKS